MYCAICGDENPLEGIRRFWSPDDGWTAGRLCAACKADALRARPSPEDVSYEKRDQTFSDEEEAYSLIYG